MNVLTLRSQITAALGAAIGTYTLANGITTPAVAVRDRGEVVDPGTSVTGLEVVILSQPDLVPIRQYTDVPAFREWTVFLVAWDASVDLQNAAATLLANFGDSDISTVPLSETHGPRNQMRMTIRSNALQITPLTPVVADVDLPKSFTIPAPQAGDNFTIFYTETATTLTQVLAVVKGSSSPSVTFTMRYATDRTAAGTLAVVSTVVTSTTTGQVVPLQQMPIPANSFVWVELTAVSGTVTEFSASLET
jgi:hypothetical protein